MRVTSKKVLSAFICSTFLLTGCGYSEDEINFARIQASEESHELILNTVQDALNNCETDFYGVIMDDGCLEDEFYYNGDFWDCELNRPADTLIDGDCLRSELGL